MRCYYNTPDQKIKKDKHSSYDMMSRAANNMIHKAIVTIAMESQLQYVESRAVPGSEDFFSRVLPVNDFKSIIKYFYEKNVLEKKIELT